VTLMSGRGTELLRTKNLNQRIFSTVGTFEISDEPEVRSNVGSRCWTCCLQSMRSGLRIAVGSRASSLPKRVRRPPRPSEPDGVRRFLPALLAQCNPSGTGQSRANGYYSNAWLSHFNSFHAHQALSLGENLPRPVPLRLFTGPCPGPCPSGFSPAGGPGCHRI
jgi:hypothetical protein